MAVIPGSARMEVPNKQVAAHSATLIPLSAWSHLSHLGLHLALARCQSLTTSYAA